MFCPNDTWISTQLPDLKKFGGLCPPCPPPADTPMAFSMVQRIKLFKLMSKFVTHNEPEVIEYPYSKVLTNIAAQKNDG